MTTPQSPVGSVAAATDVLGDKWTPRLLRFFINERVVRFCQLQDLADGINPRTLSARLQHLEEAGIIQRVSLSSSSRCEYQLTEKGDDLMPILRGMQTWSERYEPKGS